MPGPKHVEIGADLLDAMPRKGAPQHPDRRAEGDQHHERQGMAQPAQQSGCGGVQREWVFGWYGHGMVGPIAHISAGG